MNPPLFVGILGFGSASYIAGTWQIIKNKYRPNVFSRVVWLLLAINSFAGIVVSHSSSASLLLALIFLIGNALICIGSFWRGSRTMGKLEYVCLGLLAVSGLIWIVFRAPLVNLSIGLLAHFVGAIPTYKSVWANGSSESTAFWSLFFIASGLSIIASLGGPVKDMIFPIYFTFFDGSMTILSLKSP